MTLQQKYAEFRRECVNRGITEDLLSLQEHVFYLGAMAMLELVVSISSDVETGISQLRDYESEIQSHMEELRMRAYRRKSSSN